MKPTPHFFPLLTMGLLLGGLAVFIPAHLFPLPTEKVLVIAGIAVFFAGLVVALVGAGWSIGTLTSPALRRAYGLATPIVTVVVAAFAWSGAGWTLYKFKKTNDVQTEAAAEFAAELMRKVQWAVAGNRASSEPSGPEQGPPSPPSNNADE